MKSYIFLGILFFSTLLAGCSSDSQPQPKTYPVPAGAFGMNVSMAGKDFNIVANQGGDWSGGSSRIWYQNGGVHYVKHGVNFHKITNVNGEEIQVSFEISAPPIRVEDPNNVNASYTYEVFRNQFAVGKNYPMAIPGNINGYVVNLYHVNVSNLDKSFNYKSVVAQKDAKWIVTAIKELPRQGVLVTYDVNCNLYELNGNQYAGKFVGTIQVEYWYRPF